MFFQRFETKTSPKISEVAPSPTKIPVVKVIIPPISPHNTPTPGNPRLKNPTEEYQKQLLENQKKQGVIKVLIKKGGFEPNRVLVKKGGIVTWTNQDEINHQVVGDSQVWGSRRTLEKNQSFSQQFDVPGTYLYHCALHPAEKGVVVVE